MSTALPFRLLGDADRDSLECAVRAICAEWTGAWLAMPTRADFEVGGEQGFAGQWTQCVRDADMWVAWRIPGTHWREFARLLFGAPVGATATPSPLVDAVLLDCFQDLASRLLGTAYETSARTEQATLDGCRTGYGSGAVTGRLAGDLPPFEYALGGGIVERLSRRTEATASPRAELATRESAVRGGRVRVDVRLGEAELTVGELAGIAPGDVIRLRSSMREPVVATTADGIPLMEGHLGFRAACKAIRIIGKASEL